VACRERRLLVAGCVKVATHGPLVVTGMAVVECGEDIRNLTRAGQDICIG
jgi:hypothetical protein